MQMLSAILPEAAIAPGVAKKTSEPATKGVFQNVLKQESGKNELPEDLPVSDANSTTNTLDTVNPSDSETQQSSTAKKSPVEVEPEGLTDREIVSERTSEPALEDLQDSDEDTEPIAQSLMAGTILQTPMVQIPAQNPTGQNATRSVLEKSKTTVTVVQSNQATALADENMAQAAETLTGKEQLVARRRNHASDTPSSNVGEQQSTSASPPFKPRLSIHESGLNASDLKTGNAVSSSEAGNSQQVANTLVSAQQVIAAKTTSSQEMPQVAATHITQVALASSEQPATKPATNKHKAQALGDSRFSDLLGLNQTGNSEMTAEEPITAAGPHTPLSKPTPVAATQTTLTAPVPNGTANSADIAENKGNEGGQTTKPVADIEAPIVSITSPDNADTISAHPASIKASGQTATAIDVTPDTAESALGMTQGSEKISVAGITPLSSPISTVPAATPDSLPSGNGFAIPEQEVMEQVIQRSSLKELEGKRQLTVELHPEELGQVKLHLTQDNERMQLHLQAQSSEVRDILEKHLPRLQEAFQQQGLRLENIQVSVDSQRNNAQEFLDRQQQQQAHRNPWQQNHRATVQTEEQLIARPTNRANSATGLSLRI